MFDYNITQGTKIKVSQKKNVENRTRKNTQNNMIVASNNSGLSVEHDETSFPLTSEQQEAKLTVQHKKLENIENIKNAGIMPQNLVITREDGVRIEIIDPYNGDIDSFDTDFINIPPYKTGKIIITCADGNKYEFEAEFFEQVGGDIKDLRSLKQNIGDFFGKIDKSVIDNLISEKVNANGKSFLINFYSTDSELAQMYDLDSEGNAIEIDYRHATLVSPKFKPEPRLYSPYTAFTRDDGCKFEIRNKSDVESDLHITTPNGEKLYLSLWGNDKDMYNQWQIPRFKKFLNEIPVDVLKDLSNEVDSIKFMTNIVYDGVYLRSSNVLSLNIGCGRSSATPITVVHELGHAIDNYNNSMQSLNLEFSEKFEEFQNLALSLGIEEYSLASSEELLASMYAYFNIDDKSSKNHILNLDKQIEKFKNSEIPAEKRCYELFEDLKLDSQNIIEETRKHSAAERKEPALIELIRNEFKDFIHYINSSDYSSRFLGQALELDIIDLLNNDEEHFNSQIEYYKNLSQDENLTVNLRKCYEAMYTKLPELRNKIKNNK